MVCKALLPFVTEGLEYLYYFVFLSHVVTRYQVALMAV